MIFMIIALAGWAEPYRTVDSCYSDIPAAFVNRLGHGPTASDGTAACADAGGAGQIYPLSHSTKSTYLP